jgi:hypothetical protein
VTHTPDGYAMYVRPENQRWTWTLMNLDAKVAATGQAEDRESAWRTAEFAAAAVGALNRVAQRSF